MTVTCVCQDRMSIHTIRQGSNSHCKMIVRTRSKQIGSQFQPDQCICIECAFNPVCSVDTALDPGGVCMFYMWPHSSVCSSALHERVDSDWRDSLAINLFTWDKTLSFSLCRIAHFQNR